MDDEPQIIINGQALSVGEAMTVRVAIESFATMLNVEGLGSDAIGESMTERYLDRVSDIRRKMYSSRRD
jgi:hypothetical protein